ncbi:MAG TPA: hypothetical protein PK668_17235 [Myxococcota bacterium]|nr:hypothetical protein [Myxococcota bacterium]HRY94904.1 hypothetical protein [Myxococcota bacterium]HSA21818.1 hypothetical protein [Myxococcota bacterium]
MTRKLTIAVAGLALAGMALVACGEESKKTLLLTDAAAAFAADICNRSYECCTTAEMDDLRGTYWTDLASCITYFTDIFNSTMVDPTEAAIAAGRGEYDAEVAGSCEATFAARGCAGSPQNDITALAEDCEGMYRGLQAAAAPCASTFECVAGTKCVASTCQAYLALNDACTPNSDPNCAAGLYCDGANCVARKALNADCAASAECEAGLECDANLKCVAKVIDTCDGQ